MKPILILLFAAGLFAGCDRPTNVEARVNDCLQHGRFYHDGIALQCGPAND